MEHYHVILGKSHLLTGEYIVVLHSEIFLLIEETLTLDSRHIENVKLWHNFVKTCHFLEINAVCAQDILSDVIRHTKLIR